MKTKAKSFFLGLVILSLALAYFPTLSGEGNNIANSSSLRAEPLVKIIVTDKNSSPSSMEVSVNKAPLSLASCKVEALAYTGLVQGQPLINLQQSAACSTLGEFEADGSNLSVAPMPQSRALLSVQPLAIQPVKLISLPLAKIASLHYRSAPGMPFNSESAMPFVLSAALSAIVVFSLKSFRLKKSGSSQIKQSLSLEQLMVLRC